MYERIERKCMELFGECPLNIHDFQAAATCGYTDEDVLFEAAKKVYLNTKRKFADAIYAWRGGLKISIGKEYARKCNVFFKNAKSYVDQKIDTSCDTPVNWECFPDDDPTIVIYMGYPADSDIVKWAVNYKKSA